MTLQKLTIDNTVEDVSKHSHSHGDQIRQNSKGRDSKPNTRKINTSNKKLSQLSQKKKNFIKKTTGEGFRTFI